MSYLNSCKEEGSFKKLVHSIGDVFSSSESLNKSFLLDASKTQNIPTNVDIEAVRRMYSALFKTGDSSVENSLINSLAALAQALEMELRFKSPSNDPNFLNQFVIIMENTMLQSPEYLDQALPGFLKAVALLPVTLQANLVRIWAKFSSEEIRRMVETLQQLITFQVLTGPCATGNSPVQEDKAIVAATKTMKLLHYASILGGSFDETMGDCRDAAAASNGHDDPLLKELEIDVLDCRRPLVKFEEFINDPLNDQIEVDRDFTHFKNESQGKFSFLKYDFILSTATKSLGLFYDNRVRMYSERRLTLLYSLVRGQQAMPYLRLQVRRDHIIEDALVSVSILLFMESLKYLVPPPHLPEFCKYYPHSLATKDSSASVQKNNAKSSIDHIKRVCQGKKILELDEESSKLTTFNTPFGWVATGYDYVGLPLGLFSALKKFQRHQLEVVEALPGVLFV